MDTSVKIRLLEYKRAIILNQIRELGWYTDEADHLYDKIAEINDLIRYHHSF